MFPRIITILCLFSALASAQQDFRPQITQAIASGQKKIVIPPGTYRLGPESGGKSIWNLIGLKDVEIIADGVTLLGTKLTRAVQIQNCKGVTLRGLIVDYDPLPFTQGTVSGVAADKGWIDVKLHAGYPRKPYPRIDVIDPATRFRKRGMPFLWGTKAELRGDDVVRISLKDIGGTAVIGDLASLSTGQASDGVPHAMVVENCTAIILQEVTIHSAPGMGILECDGEGGSSMLGCRVVPGPKPAGATEERLLSSSWDAIQSKTMRKGPRLEKCEVRDAGDDSWSVQSSDFLVVAMNGPTAVIAFRDEYCQGPLVGDRLARNLDSPHPVIVTRKSVELSTPFVPEDTVKRLKEAAQWTDWHVSRKAIEITVSGKFPFEVGDSVFCPDRQGNGFVFRENKIHSPGRILIKAGEGLIEKNTIIDGHAGVTVCPEVPGNGAIGIRNLNIRDNRFSGTGYFCPSWWNTQAGCISITASGPDKTLRNAGAFKNIIIENNHFEDINGASIVVTSTDGLRIASNTFNRVMTTKPTDSGGSYGIDGKSLVWLASIKGLSASGNRISGAGEFLHQPVSGKDLEPELMETMRHGIK